MPCLLFQADRQRLFPAIRNHEGAAFRIYLKSLLKLTFLV